MKALKNSRNQEEVTKALRNLETSAKDGTNLMPHILFAVENYATLGEVSDVMRGVFGEYEG